ncbi:MAG TPA: alpha-amylase family protein [Cellvibrio sp.]|nr:alpha-amylase family protein [Cellvibrio sp.]
MPITIFCCRKVWIVLVVLLFSGAGYGVAADWKPGVPRTAYVNLFEWSWLSIAQECATQLGPKGYAAVQVSPPQEHIKGSQWWTRYQPVSYKIFSRSGDRHEFSAMVKVCKAAGVDIYVDTVINHMAGGIRGIGVAGSFYGNYNYPAADCMLGSFHQPSCSIKLSDYESQRENVTQCDIPGLPDLDTGKAEVQDAIAAYMKDLLSLGVAGFRVDAAKHIRPEELAAIKARVPGDYFFTQEVQKDASVYNSGDMDRYLGLGTVNEFSFMYAMKNMFLNLFGYNLSRMPEAFATWGMFPSEKATVFVNNHDSERSFCDKFSPGALCDSLSLFNGEQLFLANIFMLAYPYGYPQIMSGYYFDNQDMGPVNQPYSGVELSPRNCSRDPLAVGKWDCVHRDNRVANMVGFRNYTEGAPLLKWSSEGENRITFNRGNKGFVAINNTATTWEKTLDVGVPDANYCNVLVGDFPELGICPERARVKVVNGQAEVIIAPNSALALHFGAIVKADSIADIPLINIPDSLNLVREQAIISRKTKYIGLRPALLSAGDQAQISVAGGLLHGGLCWLNPVRIYS